MKRQFHRLRSHFVQLIMCKTVRNPPMIHDATISCRVFNSSKGNTASTTGNPGKYPKESW